MRPGAVRRPIAILVVSLLVWTAEARPAAARLPAAPEATILVPGGTAPLLQALGIAAPVEPARALIVLVRALYGGLSAKREDRDLALVLAELGKPGSESHADQVPGLLPPDVWERAVFGKKVAPGRLAAAVLGDRRAAFLYYGLFALDEETLQFFAAHPSLLEAIARRSAPAFAASSGAIAIRGDVVRLPGEASAAPRWEALVGASRSDPEKFITRLLERDAGRLARLFEAIVRMDTPHQAFCLGPGGARLAELYAATLRFDNAAHAPFISWAVADANFLLEHVAVSPDGRLAPPSIRRIVDSALGAGPAVLGQAAEDGSLEVTAPWLVQRFAGIPFVRRRSRLDALLFAQRRWAGRSGMNAEEWLEPLQSFTQYPALMLTLEQMQAVSAADYGLAAGAAATITAGRGGLDASLRLAVFQGAIALVARMEQVGSLSSSAALAAVREIFRRAEDDATRYPVAMAAWLQSLLEKGAPRPAVTGASAEGLLLDALSGVGVGRPMRTVEWEGRSYRVDLAAGERARLGRLRARQGGLTLDAVMALHQAVSRLLDPGATPAQLRLAAGQVLEAANLPGYSDTPMLFNYRAGGLWEGMREAARTALERPTEARLDGLRRRLAAGLEGSLADVLTSHVYAIALGDPETPLVPGDTPARHHGFDLEAHVERGGPWSFARTGSVTSSGTVSGSLLGLDRALARHALRPTMLGLPVAQHTLGPQDANGIAESVVALNPFLLTDDSRDRIVSALRRGRARILAVEDRPQELDALAERAGIDGIRRRLIRWAAGPATGGAGATAAASSPLPDRTAAVLQTFALAEIVSLGREPGDDKDFVEWGTAARAIDGGLGQRMPERLAWQELAARPGQGLLAAQVADLQLRVAEALAALSLPASLARGVLSYAAWDLTMTVQMADADDWLAVTRAAQAVTDDRITDYVSALVAGGPLVPLKKGS